MVRGAAGRAVAGLLARLVVPRRAVAGRCGLVVAGLALRRVAGLAVPGLTVGGLAVRGLALRRVAGLAVTGLIVGGLALLLVTGLGLLGLAGAALRTLPGRTELGSAVCAERHVAGHAGLTPRTDHLLTSKPPGGIIPSSCRGPSLRRVRAPGAATSAEDIGGPKLLSAVRADRISHRGRARGRCPSGGRLDGAAAFGTELLVGQRAVAAVGAGPAGPHKPGEPGAHPLAGPGPGGGYGPGCLGRCGALGRRVVRAGPSRRGPSGSGRRGRHGVPGLRAGLVITLPVLRPGQQVALDRPERLA